MIGDDEKERKLEALASCIVIVLFVSMVGACSLVNGALAVGSIVR